jgi:hypothetical protein
LEQDADVVMFIVRPSVYDREAEDPRRAELIIAKQRNGPIGEVDLIFQHEFTRFENADFSHEDGDAPFPARVHALRERRLQPRGRRRPVVEAAARPTGIVGWLDHLGSLIVRALDDLGRFFYIMASSVTWTFRRPFD